MLTLSFEDVLLSIFAAKTFHVAAEKCSVLFFLEERVVVRTSLF
jgi:hypothetical protein